MSRLKFTMIRVPCPTICLLILFVSKAVADNAFKAACGFNRPEQVLDEVGLEDHLSYTPLA